MNHSRKALHSDVSSIKPHDDQEAADQQEVLAWIASDAPLYRVAKPDTPPKHLVAYFVVFDPNAEKMLLVDHVKADAWLPTGGHIEPDEDPLVTVQREADEELGLSARFDTPFADRPLFISQATTKNYGAHTDVSLWYIISADSTNEPFEFDRGEMRNVQWFSLPQILALEPEKTGPHLHRFVRKLQKHL